MPINTHGKVAKRLAIDHGTWARTGTGAAVHTGAQGPTACGQDDSLSWTPSRPAASVRLVWSRVCLHKETSPLASLPKGDPSNILENVTRKSRICFSRSICAKQLFTPSSRTSWWMAIAVQYLVIIINTGLRELDGGQWRLHTIF